MNMTDQEVIAMQAKKILMLERELKDEKDELKRVISEREENLRYLTGIADILDYDGFVGNLRGVIKEKLDND